MTSRLQVLFAIVLVIAAALSRLIPHPMNFAPITAIALFGGVYFDRKYAPVLPLAALMLSDAFLGFYDGIVWVYGSFLLIVAIGIIVRSKKSIPMVAGSTLAGSVLFFIITNFGVWQSGLFYPMTAEGLTACYTAAIPFFRNALAGDFLYVAVLFGAYEFGIKYIPQLHTTKV